MTRGGAGRPAALVLRALGLGDLLTAVPALRAVRRALPEHELTLAAPRALAPLVALTGVVDRQRAVSGLAPFGDRRPAVAVNLHGRGPDSHRLLARLRPGRLVGFGRPDLGIAGPAWREDEHEVRRWCRLVGTTLDGRPDSADLQLAVPLVTPPVAGAVVVHPGAAYGSRRWPPERFAAVAAALRHAGPVVVTGSGGERRLAEQVRRRAGLPREALLAGRTGLAELAALVARAKLVVSNDTGMAHLASAYRVPSVVLFGPTPPAWWGPPHNGPHVVLWHGSGRGDQWGSATDPALAAITVDEVLDAAAGLLAVPGGADLACSRD